MNAIITIKLTATEFDNIRSVLGRERERISLGFNEWAGINTAEAQGIRADLSRQLYRLDALDKAFS